MSSLTPSQPPAAAENSAAVRPDLQIMKAANLLLVMFCGWFFLTFLYTGAVLNLSLKFFFLAILVLTLRRWTGALLLALLQVHLFFLEPHVVSSRSIVGEFVWVMATVLLMMAVSRFRTLQEIDKQSTVRRLLSSLTAGAAPMDGRVSPTMSRYSGAAMVTVGRSVLLLVACSVLAYLLMSLVPVDTTFTGLNTIREFRLRPTGYRVIMSGLLLFSVFVLAWLVINEGVWRRLSPAQAGVYLRSVFLKWLHRDLRMVTKRRLKRRRRMARRRNLTATKTIPNDSSETQHVHSDS
ncbi:MAG: hypothetical protein ABGZ23_01500 [Fuerstiella sp.]|nr:hypothetical protein [Fuerstiella sp.]